MKARAIGRLRRREHTRKLPLAQPDVYHLRLAYGRLLACAGRDAAAAHQYRLARRLYPDADPDRVLGDDDPHGCERPDRQPNLVSPHLSRARARGGGGIVGEIRNHELEEGSGGYAQNPAAACERPEAPAREILVQRDGP